MARVFLSYAREDVARAKALAQVLEHVGHSVWWDRHIRGGSKFTGAIEQALNSADAVVVLWSKSSVQSSWVCDEAAEGRDRERFVPVLIEQCRPPMGFRQYHCVDLSDWSGRSTPRRLPELRAAIEAITDQGAAPASAAQPRRATFIARRPLLLAALGAGLLALIAAAALFLYPRTSAEAAEPTIAVLPFADLSPSRDKGYLGDGIADAILTSLAREPGLSVIGRSSADQFRHRPEDLRKMRSAFGVTHILEGSTQAIGRRLRMSVRLIDASTGKDIWAEDYRRDMTNLFVVQDEVALTVAKRLKGSIAGRAVRGDREQIAVDTYALYLAARAKMRERHPKSIVEALDLAKRVVAADPSYGPGHALYADAVTLLADTSFGQIPAQRALQIASASARRAIELARDSADGHAALGAAWAQIDGSRAIAPLQNAIRLDPSRAELHAWLGAALNDIGRNADAAQNYRLAVDVDPLLPSAVWRLTVVYAASGDYRRAESVAHEYLRRGGSKAWAKVLRGEIARYRGDLASAAGHFRAAIGDRPDLRLAATRLATTYSQLGFYRSAEPFVRQEKPLVRALILHSPGAAGLVRAAPESIWFGDDLDIAVEYLANARDWASIVRLYDMPTRMRERACRFPLAALRIGIALREVGRSGHSARVIGCARRTIGAQQRGPYRNEFLPRGSLHAARAHVFALDGDAKAAFAELRRAADTGFRLRAGCGLNCMAAFDRFRSAAEYGATERRFKQLIEAERQRLPSVRA
jgi:adenylate cyclase